MNRGYAVSLFTMATFGGLVYWAASQEPTPTPAPTPTAAQLRVEARMKLFEGADKIALLAQIVRQIRATPNLTDAQKLNMIGAGLDIMAAGAGDPVAMYAKLQSDVPLVAGLGIRALVAESSATLARRRAQDDAGYAAQQADLLRALGQ